MEINIENQNTGVSHLLLGELIKSNVVGQISVSRGRGKYFIQVGIGEQSKTLVTQRKKVRWFASLDSVEKYLLEMGIRNYNVGH